MGEPVSTAQSLSFNDTAWQLQVGSNFVCCSTRTAAIWGGGSIKVRKSPCWTLTGMRRIFIFHAWTYEDRYVSPPDSAFLDLFFFSIKLPPDVAMLLFPQKQHLIQRDSYPGKITREKNGEVWARNGIGNVGESANYFFFPVTHSSVSLGRRGQTYLEKQRSAFSHSVCHFAKAQVSIPTRHSSQRGNQADATRSLVPFLLLSSPCCTLQTLSCFPSRG